MQSAPSVPSYKLICVRCDPRGARPMSFGCPGDRGETVDRLAETGHGPFVLFDVVPLPLL